MKLGKTPCPSSQMSATPRAGHRHQRSAMRDRAFCDANSRPGLSPCSQMPPSQMPPYNPSCPSGSVLVQALKMELQIPERELRADNPAASTPPLTRSLGTGGASRGSPWEWDGIAVPKGGPWIKEGLGGVSTHEQTARSFLGCRRREGPGEPEEGDAPSGITSLENRQRSPKVQVMTASRDLGIRRRENNALCPISSFFLQCRRKEVGSSFVQNMLLPCVQQVPCYGSATQLHPFAWPWWPHQAQRCGIASCRRQRPLSNGCAGF